MDRAVDLVALLFLYGVLAALVVESLVHWVPLTAPGTRYRFRVSALVAPLILGPLLGAISCRQDPRFQDVSLFVSARWSLLSVGPLEVRTLALSVAAGTGLMLLARDTWHLLLDWWRLRHARPALLPREAPSLVTTIVSDVASALEMPAPRLDLQDTTAHLLHCRGWLRPRLVLSTGTASLLNEGELRVALAHELAHIAHGDVLRGWMLFGLRAVQAFNPFAQAVGRLAAQELEWRADDRAAALTGTPLALAQALVRCARHRGDQFLGISGHGRLKSLEARCRRLMRDAAPAEHSCAAGLAVLWTGLTLLLVFVQ